AARTSGSNCTTAWPLGVWALKRAIKASISASWAARIRRVTVGTCGGVFFYAEGQFGAGLVDDLLSVLLGQLLVFLIAGDGLLDGRQFVQGQVAAAVFAVLPGVEVVVRAVGTGADHGDGTVLHMLDVEDLLEERLGRNWHIHERSIDVHLYQAKKKAPIHALEEFCRAPGCNRVSPSRSTAAAARRTMAALMSSTGREKLSFIFGRRSIRIYTPGAIPDETVTTLLEAAMAA